MRTGNAPRRVASPGGCVEAYHGINLVIDQVHLSAVEVDCCGPVVRITRRERSEVGSEEAVPFYHAQIATGIAVGDVRITIGADHFGRSVFDEGSKGTGRGSGT